MFDARMDGSHASAVCKLGSREIANGNSSNVESLLNQDFRTTGLFPLFRQPRDPEQLSKGKILNAKTTGGLLSLYSSISGVPRDIYSSVFSVSDALVVCDLATDNVYWITLDVNSNIDPDLLDVFRLTRASVQTQLGALNAERRYDRDNWRAPTLDEFDLLMMLSKRMNLLSPSAFYWSADRSESGEWLVVTGDRARLSSPGVLLPVGRREFTTEAGAAQYNYSVLSVPLAGRSGFTPPSLQFRAYLVLVSHGGADEYRLRWMQPTDKHKYEN